jgi:hypothetical protein
MPPSPLQPREKAMTRGLQLDGQRQQARLLLTMTPPPKKSWHDNLPFPRHWLAYLVLKIFVLALAIYLVLRFNGLI